MKNMTKDEAHAMLDRATKELDGAAYALALAVTSKHTVPTAELDERKARFTQADAAYKAAFEAWKPLMGLG